MPLARLLLAAVAVGALLGAVAFQDSSAVDSASAEPSKTRQVAFQADSAVEHQRILHLGGLTLTASCQSGLSVAARTALEDSIVASTFGQVAHGESSKFVNEGLGPEYGAYDVLGKAPSQTAGTLSYSRADGGQLSLPFVAAQGTPQGDCVFAGTATFSR